MEKSQIELKEKITETNNNKSLRTKVKFKRLLKFYLLPFWRDEEFSAKEYELGKIKSKRKLFNRLFTPLTIIGVLLLLFIAICAIYASWITPYSIYDLNARPGTDPFAFPSKDHPLGTTIIGWDILGRLIYGCRTALTAGLQAITISVIGGIIFGVISAYFGGKLDSIIMRIFDILIAFPTLILVLIFVNMYGSDLSTILTVYGVLGIPGYARFVRSSVLQVKENLYVNAAKTSGADSFRVMFSHILPNAISPIIASVFSAIGSTILGISALAFLGFSDNTIIDWGTDINVGRTRLTTKPWIPLWPGLFVAIAVLGFMLVGDGIRDALDPKSKK
jgi:ABC-type dipeptide/oligopeptide/nickel transport system permease subunit